MTTTYTITIEGLAGEVYESVIPDSPSAWDAACAYGIIPPVVGD